MSQGLKHGARYTSITYVYLDPRVSATAATVEETFLFEVGQGAFSPGMSGMDTVRQGLYEIVVAPGWISRRVMADGVYQSLGEGQGGRFVPPGNVIPFPTPAAAPTPEVVE